MDEDYDESLQDLPEQTKRFRHQSYNQQLKGVHLPSAFNQKAYDEDIGDNDSHFHEALEHWRQLNLSPGFIEFANKAGPMSLSMPLLLHNWRDIIDVWTTAMEGSDDEGLRALLDLLQKMAHDLRTTIAPAYDDILCRLLKLLSRSISAEALTILLETFNTLFRFLLVPSIHPELLDSTWTAIKSTLPRCLPEIQRAMAEVWGSVLRKLKSAAREKAVLLLAASAEDVDDASAWVLVYACKSVSQTLHTSTPSIISPLIEYHLKTESPEPTFNIIRRTLTALIHHVKNADGFSSLGNLVVQQAKSAIKTSDQVQIQRALDIATIPCSVRQGSRLTDAQKSSLFAELENIPLSPSLLRFAVAIYTSTEMASWLSHGMKFMQCIWGSGDLRFALQLNGALAELGWGGWKLVALPLVLKNTVKPEVLENDGRAVLEFLARVKKSRKISAGEVDLVWRTRVEKCALGRLRSVKERLGGDVASEVDDILALSSLFSDAITTVLIDLVDSGLNAQPQTSTAWVVGMALSALSRREKKEWAGKVDITKWARLAVERWASNAEVLEAIVELSGEVPSRVDKLPFSVAYTHLRDCLLSHSRPRRLAALRLLTSKGLISLPEDSASVSEVLKRCLQGEEAEIDVQGVRERVLRIGRVGQVVGEKEGAEVCARWLVAQLKVNLRPLWSPATAAIGNLAGRWGDLVWELLFSELKAVTEEREAGGENVEAGQHDEDEDVEEDEVNEQERSWRDPSAHKFRVTVGHWLDEGYSIRAFAKSRRTRERFDKVSYEYQLLATLGEVSSLAEKHNRELVPYFLHLAGEADPTSPSTSDFSSGDRRFLGKQKLVPWLTLFSKFSNPKALYATQTLRSLYTSYLSHPFRPLQRMALDCLLTYKSPYLTSRQDLFKTLLDDTRWRDELTNLNLAEIDVTGGAGGGQKEREEVVQVVVRLLFGLMLEKRGQRGRGAGADRRAAVLSALAGCREEELGLLVDLMLEPLGRDRSAHQGDDGGFAVGEVVSSVSGRQVVGYLTLLGDVIRLLGSRLVRFWPAMLGTVVDLLCLAQRKIEEESNTEDVSMDGQDAAEKEDAHDNEGPDEDSNDFSGKTLRSVRQTGLKRLADFFKVPVQFAFEPYLAASFKSVISPRLSAFATENTQSPSAILELFHIWSNEHHRAFYLVKYDNNVLPALWDCLVAQNVKPAVVERIFDVVERIVGYAEIDEVAKREILEPHVELLLTNLATLVERTKGGQTKPSSGSLSLALTTPLGQRHLAILSSLAPFATSANQATTLFSLFLPLLKKPNKQVPEKVKANILIILRDMMGLVPDLTDPTSALWSKLFNTFSSLLATLRTRKARQSLVESFARLEGISTDEKLKSWLHFVAVHLAQLNAYSTKRMDEPDFDARLAAYSKFNDHSYKEEEGVLVPNAWTPILYQAFGDIQDVDELALRSAAGYTLRRFVERVTAAVRDETVMGEAGAFTGTFEGVFLAHFLPSLRSTLSSPLQALGPNATSSFAVKADLLSVLSFTVSTAPATLSPTIAALHPLLEGGDEEANFFNNVLHIQVHRRTRALRRLGERCEKGEFRASSSESGNAVVREWLLPIATWFIGNGSTFMKTHANANKEDQQHHLTTNEAIHTLGRLSGCLGWSPYYGLVQRYLRLANSNDEWEKIYVRTVVAILENFSFEVVEDVKDDGAMDVDIPAVEPTPAAEAVAEEDEEQDEEKETDIKATSMTHAHRHRPNILAQLKGKLLPSLLAYLSPPAQKFKEDETPLTVRLPIALAIARLTLRLPSTTAQDRERKRTEMRRLATELSHMMKSRSQEVRDAVRDVLGKIALTVLGLDDREGLAVDDFDADSYLNVLVDELRTALIRGPQLHVLVTVVNSIVAKVVAGIEGRQQPTMEENEAVVDEEGEATSAKAATSSRRILLLDEIVPSVTSIASTILFGDVSSNPDANKDAGGAVPTNHNSATFREPRQSVNASYSLYGYAAQYSSPSVLPELLQDVKGVMGVTSNVKTMAVVDEVLRRVGGGLERNKGIEKGSPQASESDWLVNVIWGFVSGNVGFLKERHEWTNPKKGRKADKSRSQFIVQRNRKVDVESDQYAHNSYRFIVLGLDLLHTALRRGRFSNASPTVYKQLDALLPVLGNTLYSTSTPVLLHAMKCISLLVTRFPVAKLPGMRRALPVYVNQVLSIIKTSGGGGGNIAGTDGELMKGALRTLSTIVRDGPKPTTTSDGVVLPGVELKEKDLTFLLELVAPDLEDPDKQGVAFALLRAIVSRRFVVPEMYDIMEDQVAPLLVQSQSNTVREQARALLLQFMLDYPQGKGRLQKTLAFLLRNASSYVYESGRTSILELLSAVLTKFQAGLIAEYGEMIFVSLVMVLANDDSSKCREAAALLIATLYTRFSEDDRKNIVRAWLKKWCRAGMDASDGGKRKLAYVSLQVWGIVVEAAAKETPGVELSWLGETLEDVSQGLQQSEHHMQNLADDDDDSMDVDNQTNEVEWQLPYYSLSTFGKILAACPSLALIGDGKNTNGAVSWSLVTSHLLFPHAWVRMAACRALGQLFNASPLTSDKAAMQRVVNSPAFDLNSSVTVGPLRDVAAKLCEELKSEHLDATLGLQVVKNLVWIGRFWLLENEEDYAAAAVEGVEDEEAEEAEDTAPQKQGSLGNLPWLFSKLSYQVRGSLIRRKNRHGRTLNWSQQPLAAVRWFAAMTTYMPASRLEKFLTHILSPLYRIIEEDTIKDDQLDELRTTAIELRELIQQKVGGTVFSTTYNAIRQKVLEVRRERKTKRLVMGTLEPAVAAKRKEKKMILKKESRKRKDRSFADSRGGAKRRKEV